MLSDGQNPILINSIFETQNIFYGGSFHYNGILKQHQHSKLFKINFSVLLCAASKHHGFHPVQKTGIKTTTLALLWTTEPPSELT